MEGKEIVVFIGDIPPGGVATRHSHPGDEAIYMLEGGGCQIFCVWGRLTIML
jgi:quercetin dioxygenase-like cupin family protein